jgi:two-component system response regulator (stage 0 sporulation protein A)
MNIEEKVNAIIGYIFAETKEEREKAIYELQKAKTEKASTKKAEEEIEKILYEVGMPEHLKGHRYVTYAVNMAVADADVVDAITGELYPAVAEKFNTTVCRAERAIRHAIEVAWDRGDLDTLRKFFGNTISPNRGRPTNAEFIARIANIVRRKIANT